MPSDSLHLPAAVLWHVRSFGRESYAAGQPYRWDVARRTDTSEAVAQLTLRGRLPVATPTGRWRAGPDSMLLFRFGQPLTYGWPAGATEDYVCCWVTLGGAGLAEHIQDLADRHGPVLPLPPDAPAARQLTDLQVAADPDHPADALALAERVQHFVMELHAAAERRSNAAARPADRAVQLLRREPHRAGSLKEVAARFGVSREHLSRRFRETTGRSALDHLAQARQERALRLLRNTRLPLPEVARQAGYAHPHTLARHVRRVTGLSPTAYRQADPPTPAN